MLRRSIAVLASIVVMVGLAGPAAADTSAPSAPRNVVAGDVTSTSVRLSWTEPASTGGSAITGYDVAWGDSSTSTSGTSIVVTGLAPVTSYTFTVRARNEAGASDAVLVVQETALAPRAPGAPRDLMASGPTTSSIALDWKAPEDEGSSPVIGYVVSMLSRTWEVTNSSLVATNLEPGRQYRFSVRAVNQAGTSPAEVVIARTADAPAPDDEVPSAPRDLAVTDTTRSTLLVTWRPPERSGASPITGYAVTWGTGQSMVVTSSRARITGLPSATEVTVSVTAVNAAGESESVSTTGTTTSGLDGESTPPSPVQNLRVAKPETGALGGLTAILWWDPPARTGGSPITAYEISVDGTFVGDRSPFDYFFIVKDLAPGTHYTATVQARNDIGLSEPTAVSFWTAFEPVVAPTPPGAPGRLAVTGRDRTSLTLEWQEPDDDGGSEVLGYTASWYEIPAAVDVPGKRDFSFAIGSGPSDSVGSGADGVTSVVVQPDGKIVVGGFFDTWGGTFVGGIVRLNPDGSRDLSFNSGWGTDGGSVISLALQPDGKIVVGGFMVRFNDVPAHGIVRLNPDGSVDQTFEQGAGFNDSVIEVALQPDGKILAIGNFWIYDGQRAIGIARLHPDGRLDDTFESGLELGVSTLESLLVQPDGSIILGGIPASPNGQLTWNGVPVPGLLRVDSTGQLDLAFHEAIGSGIGTTSTSHAVLALHRQPDGRLLVGGGFPSFDGQSRYGYLVRLWPDGRVDPSFGTGGRGPDRQVNDIVAQADGRLILLGNYSTYAGAEADGIVRVSADGVRDATFDSGSGFTGSVFTGELQGNGRLLVGGFLPRFDGLRINNLVRLYAGSAPPESQSPDPVLAAASDGGRYVTEPTVTIDNLEPGSLYRVEVRAVNQMGEGEMVTVDTRTTMDPVPAPGVPSAPQNLVVTGATGTSISVDWQAPRRDGGSPVTGYTVQREGGTTSTTERTSALLTDLAPGTEYTIVVRAINQMGTGPSARVTGRTAPAPAPAPDPAPQPITVPVAAGTDDDPVTMQQTVPGRWPASRLVRSGATKVIATRAGLTTNAGQVARPRITYRSPSVRLARITEDPATGAYRLEALLRPGTRSGSVIVTVSAPATTVGSVPYEPLQISRSFTVRRS
jgi:uncharacterized delta-60 repeat protein